MSLKVKDLIQDKVYWCSHKDGLNPFVFKFDKFVKVGSLANWFNTKEIIRISSSKFNETVGFSNDAYETNIREATTEEIDWLNACVEADKFIPKDQVKPKINGFKKDDYIVLLKGNTNGNFELNFCYKQREDCSYIGVYKDNNQNVNGWPVHNFNKTNNNDWRYAFQEEIDHYNKIGKAYDVNTLAEERLYTALPFPSDEKYVKLRVIKDIKSDYKDFRNPFIPKDTITWTFKDNWKIKGNIHIENNRWLTNFSKSFFELIEEDKSKYLKPEDLVEGQWYECYSDCKTKKYLILLTDKNKFSSSKYYVYSTKSFSTCGNFSFIENFKPANLEEVYKYFPEEKFVDNWIPQVGDWCYIIDKRDSNLEVNKTYKLNQVSSCADYLYNYHFDLDGNNYINNACWLGLKDFRKALPHEIPVKKYNGEVVHCKTQDEWNFVLSKFNPKNILLREFDDSKGKTNCVVLKSTKTELIGYCGSRQNWINEGFKITSFEGFCKENGYVTTWTKRCIKNYESQSLPDNIHPSPPKNTRLSIDSISNIIEPEVIKLTVKS